MPPRADAAVTHAARGGWPSALYFLNNISKKSKNPYVEKIKIIIKIKLKLILIIIKLNNHIL